MGKNEIIHQDLNMSRFISVPTMSASKNIVYRLPSPPVNRLLVSHVSLGWFRAQYKLTFKNSSLYTCKRGEEITTSNRILSPLPCHRPQMTETKRHSPSEETIQSIHVQVKNLQCKVDSVPSQKSGAAVGARGCIEMVERGDGIKLIWQHSLKRKRFQLVLITLFC